VDGVNAAEWPPRSPLRGGGQELEQIGLEQRQDRLGLGVAEAAVELEHLRPVSSQHEPGIEEPGEGRTASRELGEHGLVHRSDELSRLIETDAENRRVRPMPPVFGPLSPSNARLKS
jgi:hypothetical protein